MNPAHDTPLPAVRDAQLTQRLEALGTELARVAPPPDLEAILLGKFRARRAPRPRLWWMPPLAMAATVAVVSWIARHPATMPTAQPLRDPGAEYVASAEGGPFLALKSLERIALEPQATVVATEFPRALLAQWGMPVAPERAGEPVRAEMLYSAEGEVLAVRLLN